MDVRSSWKWSHSDCDLPDVGVEKQAQVHLLNLTEPQSYTVYRTLRQTVTEGNMGLCGWKMPLILALRKPWQADL